MSIENKRINSRTPAECYVSGSTYRSAGAEERVYRISIDILLRWSKEVFGEVGLFSRQRRDMSIVSDVSDKCTPAECYVLECFDMVTLPEYLHTLGMLLPCSKSRNQLSKLRHSSGVLCL